jgi:uncharacterized protein DUF3313
MKTRLFPIIAAALLLAAPTFAADPKDDGLVAKRSRDFDEVRTASAWPGSYNAVYIPPIEVEFRKGWDRDANAIQRPASRATAEDVKRISQEMAHSLRQSLQESLRHGNYQIAPAPAAGVLVLRVSLEDVKVNAPDKDSYARTQSFVREAGEARLHVEGYDGASNARVLTINDRGKARPYMPGVDRANSVTNRFWFGELFDNWGESVARELRAGHGAG